MTIAIERPCSTNVFDAGLPTVDYQHAQGPEEAHEIIARARRQGPIALGPHGPELLTYDLVRATLRDSTFRVPRGSPWRRRASRRGRCGTGPPRTC